MSSASDKAKGIRRIDLPLDKIRIDAGTQWRNLDEDALADYERRTEAGERPPGVEVKFDGKEHWLFHGFHRYHVHKKLKREKIPAIVTNGTRRDAVLASFGVNTEHGVRRTAGEVKRIILAILADEEWGKRSATWIADKASTSTRYVERVISEDREEAAAGKGKPKEKARPEKRTVTRTRGGKTTTYEMDVKAIGAQTERKFPNRKEAEAQGKAEGNGEAAPPPPPPVPAIVKDSKGQVIEDELIAVPYHKARAELRAFLKTATELGAAMFGMLDANAPGWDFVSRRHLPSDFESLTTTIVNAIPHALCPMHAQDRVARKDCAWCKGCGFLPKDKFKAAEAAMKAGKKKTDDPEARPLPAATTPSEAVAAINGGGGEAAAPKGGD